MGAIGWKLDRSEREQLLRRFPPRYPQAVADHVTLQPGEGPLPPEVSAAIVGRADDGDGVEAMVVSIDGAGKLFINKDEIQPDLLEFNLKSAKAKDPEVRVQLQADDGVNYGEVARAMASIERAGITKLSVITAR